MLVLAADIGGTKSWLCLVNENQPGQRQVVFEKKYLSNDFTDTSQLLNTFIADANTAEASDVASKPIDCICLALPGRVNQGSAQLTNLDWTLDAKQLRQEFAANQVIFLNDFAAAALGVTTLQDNDYLVLNESDIQHQCIKVVTGAGTGLGMAWLNFVDGEYHANQTEGGHIDFAPTSKQQIALLEMLLESFEHVSCERVLSGNGLLRLYRFIHPEMDKTLSSADIVSLAEKGESYAQQALTLFVEIYGAYVGNLAMLYQPRGGIYIAGGIAAKILPWMRSSSFLNAFKQKGRMQSLAESVPVYLVTNERLGLQGSLWKAFQTMK